MAQECKRRVSTGQELVGPKVFSVELSYFVGLQAGCENSWVQELVQKQQACSVTTVRQRTGRGVGRGAEDRT